jgi:uncharacterized protein with ParB-like and HNH nuclease domain
MEIFENINSKGKELTLSEMIKNFIFNQCSENLLENSSDEEIAQKYNTYILMELGNNDENVEDFYKTLIHYNDGKETKNNKQLHLQELKKTIKDLFKLKDNESIDTIQNYKNLLIKVKEYAVIYYEITEKTSHILN